MAIRTEYRVSRIDRHGDAEDWNHHDHIHDAIVEMDGAALDGEYPAVVIERVEWRGDKPDLDPPTVYVRGHLATLERGGWVASTLNP